MKPWLNHCWKGACFCGACVWHLLRWTLWLVLVVLLVFQAWIAASRELAVPSFMLRMIEERLAASQVEIKFGHARFDQSGRILVENVRISLPAYREPIA